MKGFVAITDADWYRYLSAPGDADEVNFWRPSGQSHFRSLQIGEPLIFKLHYPENAIVGGGFFTHFSVLPSRLAWDAFGQKNGAASYEEMRQRIQKYRRATADPHAEYSIGCLILREPFFFSEQDWLAPPSDFSRNIVQGKTYDLTIGAGRELWDAIQARLLRTSAHVVAEPAGPMYGAPTLTRQRLGQGTFRVIVTDVYRRRCAITAEKTLPVLQAAHIRPVSDGGTHRIVNGVLLRSDLHTLFDRGYVTVAPDYRVHVSQRLKVDFDNGENYRRLEGSTISLPDQAEHRPDPLLLEWHSDTVFLR